MAKRKKKKTAKRSRSMIGIILFACWMIIVKTSAAVMRSAFWLMIMAGRGSKKNPLAAVGLCGFFLTFAFVGINALFQSSQSIVAEKVVRPIAKPAPPSQRQEDGQEDALAKIIRDAE